MRKEKHNTRILFYKQLLYKQGNARHGKNLSNFSTGKRNAKQFENSNSEPIANENRAAAIEK